ARHRHRPNIRVDAGQSESAAAVLNQPASAVGDQPSSDRDVVAIGINDGATVLHVGGDASHESRVVGGGFKGSAVEVKDLGAAAGAAGEAGGGERSAVEVDGAAAGAGVFAEDHGRDGDVGGVADVERTEDAAVVAEAELAREGRSAGAEVSGAVAALAEAGAVGAERAAGLVQGTGPARADGQEVAALLGQRSA